MGVFNIKVGVATKIFRACDKRRLYSTLLTQILDTPLTLVELQAVWNASCLEAQVQLVGNIASDKYNLQRKLLTCQSDYRNHSKMHLKLN